MSFIFSQALVVACSPDKCSDTDASAPSSGNPTPKPCSWHDRTMEVSRLSRYGMTCRPLTADRGAELLTSWLAGFPVRTSALQEKAQESTVPGRACGDTWRGSLAKFDPASSSWRTAQPSLLGDSQESSVTWPRSGMTAGGLCWELPMSALRTSGTDFGLSVEMWPTPTVCGNYNRKGASATSGDGLATAVAKWPTPTASQRGDCPSERARNTPGLASAVKWATPTVQDSKNNGAASQMDRNSRPLNAQVGGSLNPNWVEWLMGWPVGWTDLKPSGMDRFPSAPLQPSDTFPQPLSEQEQAA